MGHGAQCWSTCTAGSIPQHNLERDLISGIVARVHFTSCARTLTGADPAGSAHAAGLCEFMHLSVCFIQGAVPSFLLALRILLPPPAPPASSQDSLSPGRGGGGNLMETSHLGLNVLRFLTVLPSCGSPCLFSDCRRKLF